MGGGGSGGGRSPRGKGKGHCPRPVRTGPLDAGAASGQFVVCCAREQCVRRAVASWRLLLFLRVVPLYTSGPRKTLRDTTPPSLTHLVPGGSGGGRVRMEKKGGPGLASFNINQTVRFHIRFERLRVEVDFSSSLFELAFFSEAKRGACLVNAGRSLLRYIHAKYCENGYSRNQTLAVISHSGTVQQVVRISGSNPPPGSNVRTPQSNSCKDWGWMLRDEETGDAEKGHRTTRRDPVRPCQPNASTINCGCVAARIRCCITI